MGNLELVKYLVTHGADVNATNKYKANALHKVLDAEQPGTKKLSNERIQIVHYLISNGIDVKAKGYNDATALYLAVFRVNISIIESLIEHGADVKAKTKKGRTPLYIASVLKDQGVLDALNTDKKEAHQKSNVDNTSATEESVDKRDKNKVELGIIFFGVLWALVAILSYQSMPAFRGLVFVSGIIVAFVTVGLLWEQGYVMWAVSIGIILIAAIAFSVRKMLKASEGRDKISQEGSSNSASELEDIQVTPEVANVYTSIDDGDVFVSVEGGRLAMGVGIETIGGRFTCLIGSGEHIPCESIQIFSTDENDQEEIRITVYHGDGDFVRDSTLLGRYKILGIPKAKKGIPQIEGRFQVTSTGRFEFSAKDKSNDAALQISKDS